MQERLHGPADKTGDPAPGPGRGHDDQVGVFVPGQPGDALGGLAGPLDLGPGGQLMLFDDGQGPGRIRS